MSWGFLILLLLAVFFYGVMAMNLATAGASDLAGDGMTMAFAAAFGIAFWIVTLVLLLMARRSMPGWAAVCVFILLAMAPIVSAVALTRGWSTYAPIVLPLPFLVVAVWARVS